MYTKVCAICQNKFETNNNRVKYCSAICRTKGKALVRKLYNEKYRKTLSYLEYRKRYYKNMYQPVVKYCKVCGAKLNDGRQTYCIDCLLDDYVKTKSKAAVLRLANRGYNKLLIIKELKNRR